MSAPLLSNSWYRVAALKPEFEVRKDSPPMCFVHSSDDGVSSENSVALYLVLKKHNVPAELHLYSSGGHGYGMRRLEHLPRVARVEERIVVGHPRAERVPGRGEPIGVEPARRVRLVGAEAGLPGSDEVCGPRDEVGELLGARGGHGPDARIGCTGAP